ncbi:MAG TPA: hypothetical protein VKQ72_16170 [Aggregatilineales bacterium]|nr:hypothetical protein [Aggregatilineales bacterium]
MITVKSGINALGQFVDGQGAIRLKDSTLGMEPLGFNGIEPGTLDGQRADQQTNLMSAALDLLVIFSHPGSYSLTEMPGSIVPDQSQDALSEGQGLIAQSGEELCGDGTDRPPIHKAQADLLGFSLTHEQAITSQGFGFLVSSSFDLFHHSQGMILLRPGVQLGLLKTAPQVSSSKPNNQSSRESARPISRSRVFCGHTPGRG